MTARLIQLLTGSFLFFCLGVALFPVLFPIQAEKKQVSNLHSGSSLVRDTQVDDWSTEDDSAGEDDDVWKEEPEEVTHSDRRIVQQDEETFQEEDVPVDAKQNVVPEARTNAHFTTALTTMRKVYDSLEKQEKNPYVNDDFPGETWSDPEKIIMTLQKKCWASWAICRTAKSSSSLPNLRTA